MKKVTYIAGQYSQLKLDEGLRIFLETLPKKIRIKKMLMDIIGDYGKVLEDLPKEGDNNFFHPISKLPHSKEKIENALNTALKIAKDEQMIRHLKLVLTALETFIPDDEVQKANQNFIKGLSKTFEKESKEK